MTKKPESSSWMVVHRIDSMKATSWLGAMTAQPCSTCREGSIGMVIPHVAQSSRLQAAKQGPGLLSGTQLVRKFAINKLTWDAIRYISVEMSPFLRIAS